MSSARRTQVSRQDAGATPRAYNFNSNVISVIQLGQLDYGEGQRLQRKVVDLRKAGQIGDVLLLLEHAPVITLGRNAKTAHVLASAEELAAQMRGAGFRSVTYERITGGIVCLHLGGN